MNRRVIYRLFGLFQASLFQSIYHLLEPFDQKTLSTRHESLLEYTKQDQARPIILLGFARTGTSTLQRLLSDTFGYNTSFEPIAFNHSGWDSDSFSQVSVFFRGAPDISALPLYQWGGAPLSAIHAISDTCAQGKAFDLLKAYIQHLISFYGKNVVIKELRLIPNLPTVRKICAELDLDPIFILLIGDPFVPLYSYYRLGGLVEANDFFQWRADELYEYRRLTYASLGLFPELLEIKCDNKFDRLLLSVLLDQQYLRHWASETGNASYVVDFQRATSAVDEIARKFQLLKRGRSAITIKKVKRYQTDPFFLREARTKINPALLRVVEEQFAYKLEPVEENQSSRKQYVTWLRVNLLHRMGSGSPLR